LFVCCYKPQKSGPYFASPGIEVNPLRIHSGRVALPAVLPKVHHRPETLYVPKEVNTPQVDGLARFFGLTQAPYKSHPQPPESEINNIGWRGLLRVNPHKRWLDEMDKNTKFWVFIFWSSCSQKMMSADDFKKPLSDVSLGLTVEAEVEFFQK